MAEGDVVGTASVELEVHLKLDEESKAQIAREVADIGNDVATPEGRRGRGRVSGGSTPQAATVDAKVKTKLEGTISKDIQSAIDKDSYTLTIDAKSIRDQIQAALKAPFDITVNAEIKGAMAHLAPGEAAHLAAPAGATPRAALPDDLMKALTPVLRQNIDTLYRNISQAFTQAGKGRFGTQALEPGNEIEKAAELMGQFGTRFEQMLKVSGPTNRATGGSIVDTLKELGIDLKSPTGQGVTTAALGLANTDPKTNQLTSRATDVFFARLKKWATDLASEAPVQAAPTAAATARPAAPVMAADDAAKQRSAALREESEKASKEQIVERQRALRFSKIDPTGLATIPSTYQPPLGRGARTAIGEEDERARQQLGNDRANVRRLRRDPLQQHVAGIQTNLGPLLRLAELGRFQDTFEQFTGKGFNESQGIGQFLPEDAGGLVELSRLGKRKPGVKFPVAGKEGRFAAVRPSEAFTRTLIESLGAGNDNASIEAIRAFTQTPEIADAIKKSIGRGANPLRASGSSSTPGGPSAETKRGQGKPSIISGTGSDLGAQSKRLFEFIDYIDGQITQTTAALADVDRSIDALQGSGRPTTGLDKRAATLHQRLTDLGKKRSGAQEERAQLTATGSGIELEAARARGARLGGQSDVQRLGVGLTPAERAASDAGIFGPSKTGQRQAAMAAAGELPSQQAIVGALVDRYFSNESRVNAATGQVETGYQTLKQAAFGPGGRPRRPKEGQETGLYGELVGQLPADLGPTAKREAQQYLRETLSSVISDQGFKRGIAEEDIRRKEPMTRPLLSGITGEGQYTATPPGILGALRAKIKLEEALPAGHGAAAHGPNTDTHEELEDNGPVPGLRSRLNELEQRDIRIKAAEEKRVRARQKTLGKGINISGDESRDIARDSGVIMEGEIRHAPFEKFNEEYGRPEGPGYERLPASLGAARTSGAAAGGFRGGGGQGGGGIGAGGFGEVTGAIHVIVDNTPLLVTLEGGGGGGGRAPRAAADAQPKEPKAAAPRALRRKNLNARDVGTAADAGRIYTFEPEGEAYGPAGPGPGQAFHAGGGTLPQPRSRAYRQPGDSPLVQGVGDLFDREDQRVRYRARMAREQAAEERRVRLANAPIRGNTARTVEQIEEARTARILSPTDPAVLRSGVVAQQAQQRLQSRSLGTSLVSLAENAFGGRQGPLTRVAQLRDAANRQRGLQNQIETIDQRLTDANAGRVLTANQITARRAQGIPVDPKLIADHKAYRETVIGLTKASKSASGALEVVNKQVEGLAKDAVGAGDVLRNLGAGFVGGIGGGLVVGAVSQASQLVVKGLQETLGPVVERLSGNAGAVGRVQEGVAQGIIGANGRIPVALAQQGLAARLSDQQLAAISGPLGARGTAVAGAQSLQQQFDLLNTARAAGSQTNQGFDKSLFRSTGGIADVQLPFKLFGVQDISVGGQASTAEILNAQLKNLGSPTALSALQAPTRPSFGRLGPVSPQDQKANNDAAAKLIADNTKQLDFLNANLKTFKLVQSSNTDAINKQADLFAQAGQADLGGQLKEKGVLLQGLDTSGSANQIGQFLQELAQGPRLSAQQVLTTDQPQIQQQTIAEDLARRLQVQTVIPQQFAIGQAENPLTPAATGINTTGLTPTQVKAVNADLAQTQKQYDAINADVKQGVQDAKDFVSQTFAGTDAGQQFADALDKAAGYGTEIAKINIGVQTEQAAYAAQQYGNEIRLANRSLADAKGLTGEITKQNGDNLGIIERQQFFLQRSSQSLSLGLSQRQINFQTAIAGFQSPGLTSEEREARINEAKLEASYAQKQLDIQKQLFTLGGVQFKVSGSRQVKDINQQLNLLERGRAVSIDTAVAEKKVHALTLLQQKENARVEAFYNAAVQRTTDVQGEISKLVATTQTDLTTVGNLVLKQFKTTYSQFIDVMTGNPSATGPAGNYTGVKGHPQAGNAMGFIGGYHADGWAGTVNGATSLGPYGVAGEAGGEAVAIVRGYRQLVTPPSGKGGGGNQYIVQIYNPIVKSDEDRRKLITDVKRALQTEARLLLPQR